MVHLQMLLLLNVVLDFLVSLHEKGMSYSSLNTARSAISTFVHTHDGIPMGSHPLIQRFMKGVFTLDHLYQNMYIHGMFP